MSKVAWGLIGFALLAHACGAGDERNAARFAEAGGGGEPPEATAGVPSGGAGNDPSTTAGGQAEAGGTVSVPVNDGGAAGQPTLDDGVAGGGGDDGGGDDGDAGAGPVVLPDGVIANVPYVCASPFDGVVFDSYFYLEDFEDGALGSPGVSAPNTVSSLAGFGASLVESIDCDDGVVDGTCVDCDALYGQGTIELTFDAQVLGELPTHVGLVWTDGGAGASVSISGYDGADALIYTETADGLGDASVNGTVDEDRFFGIVHYAGIRRVVIVNSTGGLEIDHLQYGR